MFDNTVIHLDSPMTLVRVIFEFMSHLKDQGYSSLVVRTTCLDSLVTGDPR